MKKIFPATPTETVDFSINLLVSFLPQIQMVTPGTHLSPIYRADNLNGPAYQLRYIWSGLPSGASLPPIPSEGILRELEAAWETDGLRCLEQRWKPDLVQIAFSALPQVSPVLLAARAKGRLQHALRRGGAPTNFSRKVCVRTIGENTRHQVERYIREQTSRDPAADPRFREALKQYTFEDPAVDLSLATDVKRGCYWYNLHIVFVTQLRYRICDDVALMKLRDGCVSIARKKGHAISTLAVLPDHVHMALRGNVEQSPEEIVLGFLNNLAYMMGQNMVWMPGYYAGTFGEYNMDAVRLHVRAKD